MKIAVPTTQSKQVDAHFGHCEFYSVFTIGADKTIMNTEILDSPQGCGCKSNIAGTLKDLGVTIMLAGNMGGGAVNVLQSHGIEVFRGNSGDVKQLVENFIAGNVEDSGQTCNHHEDGHVCNH
ncbi:MAG: NifB/NifX family molybdenum-iron cluster-binding protein [Bacteroidota bacterium]|nr:NifB/NifX family molybdenum-iron cluster-binding protein [Bacteroidota bacterium]